MQIPSLKTISPAPRAVWQSLFKADAEALPYQSPAWFDCVCEVGNYEDISRHYETSDGRQFVMPLARRRGLPDVLSPVSSLPYGWGIGGLIGSENIRAEEVAAVFADLESLSYPRISLRPNPRQGAVWAAAVPRGVTVVPRRAHVLDLEGGFDKIWNERFGKSTRRAIRKAEQSGIVVECDTTGRLVPVFYDLLKHSFDRWSHQQHEPRLLTHLRGQNRDPLRKFQVVAERLGEACRVWVAWVNGQPAASILLLQYGNVNDSRAAMNKELAASTGANDIILKLAIEDACRAGCRYYHLGESGNSTSLSHYKERFGAVAYPYAEYHIERIPFTRMDLGLRRIVKRVIGFKDV